MAAILRTSSVRAARSEWAPVAVARVVLATIGGLSTAAFGDVAVEASIRCGFFGSGYLDRSHETIVPLVLAGIALLLLETGWMRMSACDDRRLVLLVREAAGAPLCMTVATGFAGLLVSLALERVEQVLGGGLPFGGLSLASFAGAGVIVVYLGCAALVVASLGAVVRSLAAAFHFVAAAVFVLYRLLAASFGCAAASAVLLASAIVPGIGSSELRRLHGDRAPPRRAAP